MKNKKLYICEHCGKKYANESGHNEHEDNCLSYMKHYSSNVQDVIDVIKNEYGSIIKSIEFTIKDSGAGVEQSFLINYIVKVNIELSNKNKTWVSVDYAYQDLCYCQIKEQIENLIPVKYDGVITYDSDQREWRIGDVLVSDIVDRLEGRIIKLEAVD